MLQLFYPKDSINPAKWPKGGSEFYATPLDISKASNVTLEYKVFFPGDFDWVKGGNYQYAPKDRQIPPYVGHPLYRCVIRPMALHRSRIFRVLKGAWTHVSQTVVLNSPGVQDGNFLLEVNGKYFFGGHHTEFATPKDQFVWFKDFALYINDL
ncbi:hypothetical protein BJV77DRAFT_1060463 [Russula vinacea]|nr:hypothetical protein BJV77DRAFT_1060463 [Russula vinacea]